jgi:ATP-dependent Lon protease
VEIPRTLPILPVRDNVYFPNTLAPVLVGREKSLRAVEAALEMHNKLMLLVTQRDVTIEEPMLEDLFEVGVVAEILQAIHAPDNTMRVVFRGVQRARLAALESDEPYLLARVEPIPTREAKLTTDIEALMRSAVEMFEEIASHERSIPPEVVATISYMQEPGRLADTIAHFAPLRFTDKQKVLETVPVKERLETLVHLLRHELEVVELQQRIRDRVEQELGDTQREYYLREQLKIIQRELGERDDRFSEVEDYRKRIAESGMPEDIAERALKEVDRLEKMPFGSPEASVIRTYLDVMLSLPWREQTEDRVDIAEAAQILDEDHYGLKRSRSACWSSWRCANSQARSRDRFCALWDRQAWARPRWVARLPARWDASSSASRWAACATRRRSADTDAPTSARCPDASFRGCDRRARATPCSCWTKSTNLATTSAATRPPPCWRR